MIPIIAASAARNSSRNGYVYSGSSKVLDRCFIYTIIGFVCCFGILAIL